MAKFKVGDKVRIIKEGCGFPLGGEGIIKQVKEQIRTTYYLVVKEGSGFGEYVYQSYLGFAGPPKDGLDNWV